MSAAPTIVLVRPREQGNVGAVARAMANMGLADLRLVEPAIALGSTARAFAMHAHDILDGAVRYPDLTAALADREVVVGTASLRDRGWTQPVLAPRELPRWLDREAAGARAAIVFGSEVSGLTAAELARAEVLVRIPAAPAQPTLNLAQAVLVVAYELYVARGAPGAREAAPAERAKVERLERLFDRLEKLLADVGFARDTTFRRVALDLRQLLGRAGLSEREAVILSGVLRRARHALGRAGAIPLEAANPGDTVRADDDGRNQPVRAPEERGPRQRRPRADRRRGSRPRRRSRRPPGRGLPAPRPRARRDHVHGPRRDRARAAPDRRAQRRRATVDRHGNGDDARAGARGDRRRRRVPDHSEPRCRGRRDRPRRRPLPGNGSADA